METPSRPQTDRQLSRVPGGFDTDDDFSPVKSSFNHNDPGQLRNETADSISTENATVVEENSMLTTSSEAGGIQVPDEPSTLEEREIRKRLMEEDSTFLPPLSPFTGSGRYDTLTSGDSDGRPENTAKSHEPALPEPFENSSGIYQTPAPGRELLAQQGASAGSEATEQANSSSDIMSPSPTARAAARKRATSVSSTEGYKTADDEKPSSKGSGQAALQEDTTPRKVRSRGPSASKDPESPTPTKQTSSHVSKGSFAEAATDADISLSPSRKRPTFLTSRMSTQKSSFSTYTTVSTEGGSDVTLGADYALQTGGAAPFGSSTSSRPRMDYSRTTSLGSMASGISGISEEDRIRSRAGTLEEMRTLSEEDPSTVRYDDSWAPETPRAASTSTEIPTDTVLTRRVNDVEVPATAAREYRDRNRPPSPNKRNGGPTPSINRTGRNLTLKEQSGTIDRLTKENFDLKMKITFLNDSLNKRSPEGVAGLVNENADLKASKVTSAKEIRDLKRSIRDLERMLRGKEDELAEARRTAKSENDRAASGMEINKETEEELLFLRDRVVTYDVEIERLRHESFVREGEKRRMADILQSRRSTASDVGAREEVVSGLLKLNSEATLTVHLGHVEGPT